MADAGRRQPAARHPWRACYHPCETSCNRADLDQAVSIHAVERFVGDMAVEKGWTVPTGTPTGKKVLIVGAGPAGLACAWHLRRFGHEVEICDAMTEPGGMLHYGIPAYARCAPSCCAKSAISRRWACASLWARASRTSPARWRRAASMPASLRSAPTTAITSTFRLPMASR